MTSLARQAAGDWRASAATLALLVPGAALVAAATRSPVEILVVVAAVAAVVVCTLRVEIAILLLVASIPLELAITLGSSSQLTITKLAGALCFGAFALNAVATQRRLRFDLGHALVFLLLAIALVSTLQAEELSPAIVTTTRYASFVALFFIVSQFVGAATLQRRIAWTLSVGSAVTGVLASWNFLSGATLSARLPNGDPNDIAFVLATTLPFTMWLLRERGWRRAAATVLTVVIGVSILLTLSRGALVGLGTGLVWYTLAERRRGRAALVGSAAAIGLAVLIVVQLEHHRIETGLRAKEKVASSNVQTRLEAWSAAARLAADHPLTGVGPGNFQFRYLEATGRPPGTKGLAVVHDTYLDVASELGLVALVLFGAYLVVAFSRLSTAVRRALGPPGFASAARVSLVIALAAGLTLSEQYFAPFWLLGALASALVHEREPVRAGG
jgi:O-antigen ligase